MKEGIMAELVVSREGGGTGLVTAQHNFKAVWIDVNDCPSLINNRPAPDSDSVTAAVPTGPQSVPGPASQQDIFQLHFSEVPKQVKWSWRQPRSWDLHSPHSNQQEGELADVFWAPPTAPTGRGETRTDGE